MLSSAMSRRTDSRSVCSRNRRSASGSRKRSSYEIGEREKCESGDRVEYVMVGRDHDDVDGDDRIQDDERL